MVVLLALTVGCASSSDRKLTPEQAKRLLPEAASIRVDLDVLANNKGDEPPKLPTENQSPTYWVLNFPATEWKLPKDAAKNLDIFFRMEAIDPAKVIKAMNVSKAKGFASIIQPEYITDCKVESDDDCATGFVVFKRDAYSGSINFKASRVKQAWVIQEFEWPNICVRFMRGNDNNWSQEPVKK